MRTLSAFVFVTLNGFYKGPEDDISWHHHSEEGNAYSIQQMKSGNILLFGRKTYDMMNSFWPTPMASQMFPEVAKGMNESEKIVVSNSLKKATWKNTQLVSKDAIDFIRNLKQTPGKNITILGSGNLIEQLAQADLIDEYILLIDPVTIEVGTPLFQNLELNLELVKHQVFKKSGAVLLTYKTK